MNKTVYVNSYFKPVGKNVSVKVPTGEKKKGFFGGEKDITRTEEHWEQTGWSDCEIDGLRLAEDVQKAIEQLNTDGYVVVSVTPITSGRYNYEWKANGSRMDNQCAGAVTGTVMDTALLKVSSSLVRNKLNNPLNSEPSRMKVAFHTDPVSIQDICTDLEIHGAAFIETTRTNFRNIADAVEANGTKVLPLAAKGPDGDFHNFLLRFEDSNYQVGITEERVLSAILAWRAAGEPIPHVEIAELPRLDRDREASHDLNPLLDELGS